MTINSNSTPPQNDKRPSLNLKLEDIYKKYSSKYIKNFTNKNYAPNKKS